MAEPLDPELNALADNGGGLLTHKPKQGSPLIDAGSNPSPLTTDNRGTGFARIRGTSADIGAIETNPEPTVSGAFPSADPLKTGVNQAVNFGVNASDAENETLAVAWEFGDGATGAGATISHAFAAAGTYAVEATVSDAENAISGSVLITVIAPPQISSGPIATPASGFTGQTIAFTAAAQTTDTIALSYAWNFGDGSPSVTGASVSHVFSSAGTYNVTLTVTDSVGQQVQQSISVVIAAPLAGDGVDSDGDGFSDSFETATGGNPSNAAETPGGLTGVTGTEVLTISSLKISLNFAKDNSDSDDVRGMLPLPAGFSAPNTKIIFDIGGNGGSLTLDAKGKSPKGAPKFSYKPKKGAAAGTLAPFSIKRTKSALRLQLADEQLTGTEAVKDADRSVTVTVLFGGKIYKTTKAVKYTATAGKTGKTK